MDPGDHGERADVILKRLEHLSRPGVEHVIGTRRPLRAADAAGRHGPHGHPERGVSLNVCNTSQSTR
jgi:hypothetical protein